MSQQPRRGVSLAIAVVIGIVLILVVRSLTVHGSSGQAGPPTFQPPPTSTAGRGPCIELAVTASSEKAALLKEFAAAFVKQAAPIGGRCVSVAVTSKSSGSAMAALAT